MIISICGGKTLTLENGTVGTFFDKDGQHVAVLTVSGDCWSEVPIATAGFDRDKESHFEFETTVTDVPAASDPVQIRTVQAVRICKNKSGQVVTCPPR